jgi:SCY1-like protein 1
MAWILRSVGLGSNEKDAFPYTVGEKIGDVGLWELHNATRKTDGEACSVLIFDRNKHHKMGALGLNVYNSMKRLRHPAMVQFLDGKEAPDKLFVVTEQLRLLKQVLPSLRESHPGAIAWGLHEIVRAVHFLNVDCGLVHGNVTLDAIVVNRACDWKLAGLELVSDTTKRDQPLEHFHTLLPDVYKPPELTGTQEPFWVTLCRSPRTYDAWLLGCLMSQIFHEQEYSAFRGESQVLFESVVFVFCY